MAVQALAAAARGIAGAARGAAKAAGKVRVATGAKGALDTAADLALQRQLDIAKVSLLGLFYLVFPLVIIVLIMVFELLLQYVRPSWQLALWRKVLYIVTILFTFFLCLVVIGTLLYINDHPDEACQAMGGAWSVVGAVGGCSVAKDLFDSLIKAAL